MQLNRTRVAAGLIACCLFSVSAAQSDSPEFSNADIEWFEREVRPILVEQCSSCHSRSFGNVKGGLSLEDRASILAGGDSGPAIVPGQVDQSLLIEAVRRESYEMPPEKALPDRELKVLVEWVQRGAPWPAETNTPDTAGDWRAERLRSHWAWQPIEVPQVPTNAARNPVDAFILQKLTQNKLQPAKRASAAELRRRLSFDMTGLPPTAGEATAEYPEPGPNNDEDENAATVEHAYAQEVERLLTSPQFGVHWGRHWLDLVRYAETLGHEFDYPIHNAWRYRDAVIDSLNTDTPYDRFVTEHIAGDLIPSQARRKHPRTGVDQSLALSGYWWLGESVHAPVDLKNDWATRVDNQIDVFSKAFLGMTVACARCHDHKFDAIGVDDYYGLSGMIQSTRRREAHTDPFDKIAKHCVAMQQQIATADATAEALLLSNAMQQPEALVWLKDYISQLAGKKLQDELPLSSPLVPLRALLEPTKNIQDTLSELRTELRRAEKRYAAWEDESELFADFSSGVPPGWNIFAPAKDGVVGGGPGGFAQVPDWRTVPIETGTWDWFSGTLPYPALPGVFSSARFGTAPCITLQSPTFVLQHPMICLKSRGQSADSVVVVGNYFMDEFNGLLFRDVRKKIEQDRDSGWVTHAGDLNKYLGEPTFLSLEDVDNAWFEVEEIRFANSPPPPAVSHAAIDFLEQEFVSEVALLDALAEQIANAFRRLPDGQQSSRPALLARAVLVASERHQFADPKLFDTLFALAEPLKAADSRTPKPVRVMVAADGPGRDAPIAIRGNPHTPGDTVARSLFVSLPGSRPVQTRGSGRWQLSQALTDPSHPLTARVIVNRVWHHLMGRGLCGTPDNLGVLGGRPSHPELLDYLASELIRHDWSIKWLVREIVMSETYQLSTNATPEQLELDADGRLWSHRTIRRLSAEALRDSMLSIAGSLDTRLDGPSAPVHLSESMTGRGRPGKSGPLDGDGRRTVFVEVRRNFLDPFLLAFDFPMPATTAGDRNQSNVPAQALGLLNDPLVGELTKRWSQRWTNLDDSRERVGRMIGTAFGRPATPAEIEQCLSFVESLGDDGWQELAHVLLNSKEFSYLR